MSHAVSGGNLQSLGATTFLSDVVPVVQNEEAGQPNETFLSDVVPVVQNEEAGQPNETFLPAVVPVVQNEEAGQPLERHVETEPRYPPRTFHELIAWSDYVLSQSQQSTSAPITLKAYVSGNFHPIMVDARINEKTLTWPADPFDETHFDSNTTAYFIYESRSLSTADKSITCRLYTPAFKQYASANMKKPTPNPQRYLLGVVEDGDSALVKFVNEANTGIYTDIILEGSNLDPDSRIFVSMHIMGKDKKPIYLIPSIKSKVVTKSSTSPNSPNFEMKFYEL